MAYFPKEWWATFPLLVMGGSAFIGGILALIFLPETFGKPLPETMEDAINLDKKPSSTTTN
jgi:hypothetical protein